MSQTTGFNRTAATDAVNLIISGGATVRLMTTAVEYDDGNTELDTKEVSGASYSSVSVPEAGWAISYDNNTNTLTLQNDTIVDFGAANEDWGTVVDIVIQDGSTDAFIIADETNDPQITEGEDVSFPIDNITYTLGA